VYVCVEIRAYYTDLVVNENEDRTYLKRKLNYKPIHHRTKHQHKRYNEGKYAGVETS